MIILIRIAKRFNEIPFLFPVRLPQIAGVVVNGVLHGNADTSRALEKLAETEDEKFRTIFTLLYEENLKIDLFEQFAVEKIFEIRILSVDSK